MLCRKGAQAGDLICVTGDLGGARTGLEVLQAHRSDDRFNSSIRKFLEPQIPLCFPRRMLNRASIHSMIDISDGLVSEIHNICESSGQGCVLNPSAFPISAEAVEWTDETGQDIIPFVLNSGEEYELLFTVPAQDEKALGFLKDRDVRITVIGEMKSADYGLRLDDGTELLKGGLGPLSSMKIHSFRRMKNVRPYQSLADVYDEIMDHVDYENWADYICRVFKRYGTGIQNILEGGCGTGSLDLILTGKGYNVFGFDLSRDMINKAVNRVRGRVWLGDIRCISVRPKQWDAFLCLYDTVQYLNISEISGLMEEVKGLLRPGGLFIFDVVTEHHILKHWQAYSENYPGDGWQVMRRSWYEREEQCLHTEFTIGIRQSGMTHEHHRQWIFKLSDITDLITTSGLQHVASLHGFSMSAGTERSGRVHFVCQKEDD
ncbi:hypothetical protein BVY01_05105 [bacterium I07]|nr:hypothetical protein BVY01_05105 [bacterium I07]